MKTLNKHPKWFNKPLRLTKMEKKNPILVFNEFFECYHLHDCREVLWDFLIKAVCHDNCSPQERSCYLHFYEQVEQLIEAVFIVRRSKSLSATSKPKKKKL